MKRKNNSFKKTWIIAASAGAAAVAVSIAAAYRSTVKNLVPTKLPDISSVPEQTFSFPAPSEPDVPVQNTISNVPITNSSASDPESDAVQTNKPIVADVGNIMPVEGEVSHQFSGGELVKSETLGVWKTHDGCDILCDIGTDVKSMSEGVVKEIKDDPLWGVYVIVDQNNGLDVQYCGLAKELNVKAGQEVKQGEIIGKTSDTNQCEILQPPHLHLGVKQGGEWIDPIAVIENR